MIKPLHKFVLIKKEEKENVARKLLQQKIDINVIIHATGLTKEEVEKIK